jgi:4-methylaminobutanoate oxidase (formaldehyde-forming)
MSTDDLVAAFYLPDDSITNPIETTRSLAKGAKINGAMIFENVTVTDIKLEQGAVCGVRSTLGDISCEYVVNCAGMWGRRIGRLWAANKGTLGLSFWSTGVLG